MQKLIIGVAPDISVEITGDNPKDIISQAAFWHSLPTVCPKCGAALIFTHKTPQDYVYYGLRCMGSPSHATNFGQPKKGDSLYYKNEWQIWQAGSDQHPEDAPAPDEHAQLDKELEEIWQKGGFNGSLRQTAETKFNTPYQAITTMQKRQILETLKTKVNA